MSWKGSMDFGINVNTDANKTDGIVSAIVNFAENKNKHSHVWYRWFNEFPVIILIIIVFLVIYKPYI